MNLAKYTYDTLNHRFTSSPEDWLATFTRNQLGDIRQASATNSRYAWAPTAVSLSYTSNALNQYSAVAGNPPGTFRLNPNGLDIDYFDGAGNLSAQFHESHGEAHGHNFFDGKRDPAHLPMSPIPYR